MLEYLCLSRAKTLMEEIQTSADQWGIFLAEANLYVAKITPYGYHLLKYTKEVRSIIQ